MQCYALPKPGPAVEDYEYEEQFQNGLCTVDGMFSSFQYRKTRLIPSILVESYFILEIDGRKGFLRHLEKMFSAMIPITRSRISTNVLKGRTMVNLDGTLSNTRIFTCSETCTQILVAFYLFLCAFMCICCNLHTIRMCSRRSKTPNSLILMIFHLNGLA